jgi:exodeoxyribonuclease V beta subunit
VALTRARHQVIVWWAASYDTHKSPLTRLLFCRDDRGDIAPEGSSPPADAEMLARLNTLADRAEGAISVEPAKLGLPSAWRRPLAEVAELHASTFDRGLDLRWRRTSYSDITAAVHEAWVTSEPEEPLIGDEPPAPEAVVATIEDGVTDDGQPVALAGMPAGTEVGTFVHRVLEATDFAAPDLPAELAERIDELQGRRAVDIGDPAAVVQGLGDAIRTPLGPVLDGLAMRDVARVDRLDELAFELPLAGGDEPRGWAELSRFAEALDQYLPADDPLRGYAQRLREDTGLRESVRGYLTGSLDLVVRIPGTGRPRFAVLDYKTNWLGEPDEPLTALAYRPAVLAAEMQRHHYALQGLLYLVALHRYLRWRVPGYDPNTQLAGFVYLFLRGMTSAAPPASGGVPRAHDGPSGVFGWRPPAGLVSRLSDVLDAAEVDR